MKPTVPEVLPIVRGLYRRHAAGCCWHVVLDDGNYDSVRWVVDSYMPTSGCRAIECRQLAELLPQMSATQLRKLRRLRLAC